jgi:SAM-dependent methyltransferase
MDLNEVYENSSFDYSTEVHGPKKTYLGIMKKVISKNNKYNTIFEIGGGIGFFLEAEDLRFTKIAGVEPSIAAISDAREDMKPYLINSMMNQSIFPKNEYEIGVIFHVLDHLQDPVKTLKDCLSTLKPGGIFIAAVHNERSWSARLLRERSPVIDVEHTYLYPLKTGKQIFQKAGFVNVRSGSYSNHYSLAYIVHLLPVSRSVKKILLNSWVGAILRKIKIIFPLGNIWVSGVKPQTSRSDSTS